MNKRTSIERYRVHGYLPDPQREWTSRSEAEAVAAEVGGTVQRVTTTVDDVGLRWARNPVAARLELFDGETSQQATIQRSAGAWHWIVQRGMRSGACDTLDEAKAAAEAAVREGWT